MHDIRALRALLVVLGLVFSTSAEAQIVNVLSKVGAEEGLSGGIEVGADWQTGNVNLLELSGEGSLHYLNGPHLVMFTVSATYGIEDDDIYDQNIFEHLRYRPRVVGDLEWELFAQHEFDKFRRLDLRALVGTGPRVKLMDWDGGKLMFGSAYMAEYIVRPDDGLDDANDEELNHRWSSYVNISTSFTEVLSISQTFFAQPRFDAFDDVRYLSDTSISAQVSESFALVITVAIAYDSAPPEEVANLETGLETGLAWGF
jgi:hypothetical protein